MRAAAQMISHAVSIGLVRISVVLCTGSLRWCYLKVECDIFVGYFRLPGCFLFRL